MAVTLEEAVAVAKDTASLAEKQKSFDALTRQLVSNNQAKMIDWANMPPEMLDADGRLIGTTYFPADISNALGSFVTYADTWEAGHGGNFEKLCKPVV